MATEAVASVTGGRFVLLQDVAQANAVGSIKAIEKEYAIMTAATIKLSALAPSHAFFRELLSSKSVDIARAYVLLSKDKVDALLRANIISLHSDCAFIFHSRHVENFIRKHAEGGGAAPPVPGVGGKSSTTASKLRISR